MNVEYEPRRRGWRGLRSAQRMHHNAIPWLRPVAQVDWPVVHEELPDPGLRNGDRRQQVTEGRGAVHRQLQFRYPPSGRKEEPERRWDHQGHAVGVHTFILTPV